MAAVVSGSAGASAGAAGSALDARCSSGGQVVRCAADALPRYIARATGDPLRPYQCDTLWPGSCSPRAWDNLRDCLDACDPGASATSTTCTRRSAQQQCDASQTSGQAWLEARTPLGALSLRHARLDHYTGFIEKVHVTFTDGPNDGPDSRPNVHFGVSPDIDRHPLVGTHVTTADFSLCDQSISLPVEVTITLDHVTQDDVQGDERFEGSFHTLAPDLALDGQFSFERVCYHGIDD